MIDLAPHPQGVVVPVRAQPGARANGIRGVHGGMLKVAVTQVAEKGKATEAVIDTLAECLGLKRSQLGLVAGTTSREKKVLVQGVSLDELRSKIEAALADSQ